MSSELKPCPFCGGRAKLTNYRVSEDAMGCHIACTQCRAQTDAFEDAYTPDGDAAAAWNLRPARLEALEAENARLREALEPFARYASENGFGLDNNGAPLPDTDGVGWIYLTNGDFRAARRALAGAKP